MSDKYQTLKRVKVGKVFAEPGDWVLTDDKGQKTVEKANDSSVLPDDLPEVADYDDYDGNE